MPLPKITGPVQAWMLLSDAGTGRFMIWEIIVVSGPEKRHHSQSYKMGSTKKLVWSFRDQKEVNSRTPPEFYWLGASQIAFTREELIQKFGEGREKFANYKKGDIVRTIGNIEYAENLLKLYKEGLEYSKTSEKEMRQLTFPLGPND